MDQNRIIKILGLNGYSCPVSVQFDKFLAHVRDEGSDGADGDAQVGCVMGAHSDMP